MTNASAVEIMSTLFLIMFQFFEMYVMILSKVQIWPIDVLLTGFQMVTWFIHMGELRIKQKINIS